MNSRRPKLILKWNLWYVIVYIIAYTALTNFIFWFGISNKAIKAEIYNFILIDLSYNSDL